MNTGLATDSGEERYLDTADLSRDIIPAWSFDTCGRFSLSPRSCISVGLPAIGPSHHRRRREGTDNPVPGRPRSHLPGHCRRSPGARARGELVRYRERYRPTRAERRELEESYRDLFPELVPLFTRRELVQMIDRLRTASREERRRYELTDYHWLVLRARISTATCTTTGLPATRSVRTRSSASTSMLSWIGSSSTPTSCWGRPCSPPRIAGTT